MDVALTSALPTDAFAKLALSEELDSRYVVGSEDRSPEVACNEYEHLCESLTPMKGLSLSEVIDGIGAILRESKQTPLFKLKSVAELLK